MAGNILGYETDPLRDDRGPVGQVTSHVSVDDNGPVCGWSFNVGDGRIIYCGEISKAAFAELGRQAQAAFGGKPFGWFLMCFWHDRHEVWAKAAGDDEARKLVTLIGSMLYAGHLWRQELRELAGEQVDRATAED